MVMFRKLKTIIINGHLYCQFLFLNGPVIINEVYVKISVMSHIINSSNCSDHL